MSNSLDEQNFEKKSYHFTAVIGKINYQDYYRFGHSRILLQDVRIGGLLFRDHLWVKLDGLEKFKQKDIIKFRSRIKNYFNSSNFDMSKIGLTNIFNPVQIGKVGRKIKLKCLPYKECLWKN